MFAYCQLIYLALISTRCGGIYNVGTGKGISLEQQINEIVDVFSKDKEFVIKKCPEKSNARQFIMDISKAKEELGWEATKTLDDMCKDSWNYIECQEKK